MLVLTPVRLVLIASWLVETAVTLVLTPVRLVLIAS